MKHSQVIQGLVDNNEIYLKILADAAEYLRNPVTADRLVALVQEVQADKVSPTLLLPEQRKTLEEVLDYAQRQPVVNGKQEVASSSAVEPSIVFNLDLQPADNGNKRTTEDWFDRWEKDTSSKEMASAGDLYQGWKLLKRDYHSGDMDRARITAEIVASFQDDFDWSGKKNYLIAGTRLEYQADSLDSTIIQHYKAKNHALVKKTSLEIPEYLGVPIPEVVLQPKGLHYLQTLLDTEDDAETIMQTLEFISGKTRDKIKVWTPPLESNNYYTRKQHPARAAGFGCSGGYFHVDGYNDIDGRGCSRGVELGSAAGAAKI